jgi:hypothetical protein
MADGLDEARGNVAKKKPVQLLLRIDLRDWGRLSRFIGQNRMQIKKSSRSHSPAIGEEGGWVGELMGAGKLHEEENLIGAVLVWVT